MSPEEIDRAIEALPDDEHDALHEAAVRRWTFRAQNWLLPIALVAFMFVLYIIARQLLRAYWPGSLTAATLATLFWCGAFYGLLRFMLSIRVAMWRTRWAARREYKVRSGAG